MTTKRDFKKIVGVIIAVWAILMPGVITWFILDPSGFYERLLAVAACIVILFLWCFVVVSLLGDY